MNKVILIGNLTRDPELSQTPNGVSVCKFSLAVSRNFTNANGEREVDFINIVTWKALAENCERYLKKGNKAGVCGAMQTRSYDDKNGDKRYVTEVIASEVEFLSPADKSDSDSPPEAKKSGKKIVPLLIPVIDDEDLPF